MLVGIAGVLLLWVSIVYIGRIVDPNSENSDSGDAEVAEVEEVDEVQPDPTGNQANTAGDGQQDGPSLPVGEDLTDPELPPQHNFVTRRIAMNNVQVDRMKRQLDRRGSAPTIAYRSAEGIAFVHLSRGVAEVAAVLDQGQVQAGHAILRSGGESFAIDQTTLVPVRVASGSSIVVADTADGSTYFVDASGLAGTAPDVETSTDGENLETIQAPLGHQLIAFDGLGLAAIAKGPSGGTELAGPDGFVPLSSHRVLAATATSVLEQVCESPLVCKLSVATIGGPERWDVPASFGRLGDTYYLAPDGGSLLRVTPEGFGEAFVAETNSIAWIIGQGMKTPKWGAQSSYIAWLDLVGEPNLKLMFVDERDWLSIDLSALDAPLPIGPEFVIFENAQLVSEP